MGKRFLRKWFLVLGLALGGTAHAKTVYVDKGSSNPTPPYTNTVTAAHAIQDALDVAVDGDEVVLATGTYTPTAELAITNRIVLRGWTLSLENAKYTVISGGGGHRVLNLGTNDCEVAGLTIRGGSASDGAGIYCADSTPLVWNCVVEQNEAGASGGGMYRGTASGCVFAGNSAYYGGATRDTVLEYCTVQDNRAAHCGGIYGGTAYKCKILNNQGTYDTGGVYGGSITSCLVIGNLSVSSGGGVGRSTAISSVIAGNHAGTEGGGSYSSTLIHCTLTGNSAFSKGGGAYHGTVKNSILWDNSAYEGANVLGAQVYASCAPELDPGSNGNITNNPHLVSVSHLASDSPCIGAGDAAYSVAWDIDGEGWKNPPSMGCDERADSIAGGAAPFNSLPDHVAADTKIHFQAWVEGPATMTTLDFDDGTSITNFAETELSHTWAFGNYNVILTAFSDQPPYRTSITNTIYVRGDRTIYVAPNGSDANDGLSWTNALRTVQAGVDAQTWEGGTVLLSNGTYAIASEIVVDKQVRIQGLDGAENTVVKGNGSQRCFNLQNSHCTLKDLTIRDGGGYGQDTSGGGAIYCSGPNPVAEGCIITRNTTSTGGGAMWRGTATNCTFSFNTGGNGPGAMQEGVAVDCLFENNRGNGGGSGGGAMGDGVAIRCVFRENTNVKAGGAVSGGRAYNCRFLRNQSDNNGGGMAGGIAENCVFRGNRTKGAGGGTYQVAATHCTCTANEAGTSGGGMYSGSADHCIAWYNSALQGMDDMAVGTCSDSCSPDLEHGVNGNITNSPQLVSASHISPDSPCAGSGTVPRDTLDIDGENWRSSPAMGCDEPRLPYSAADISISIDGPAEIPAGYEAYYFVDIQGAFYSDYIEFGDGQTAIHGAIRPIYHTWTSPGTYDLVVSTYDESHHLLVAATNTVTVYAADFNTIYVATNGSDSADGKSWASAKQTIQAAIDAQDLPGGRVMVSNGVYTLAETVKIDKDIQLIGLNGAAQTIIDAGSLPDYHYSRGMEIGDVHCTVDGFTIRNATYTWTGGGIFCDYTTAPVISNCRIVDNEAGTAGGAFCGSFTDCVFSNNTASTGVGGALHSGSASRCTFVGNQARDGGGGMYAGKAVSCVFSQNQTGDYGGGMLDGEASRCTFAGNEAIHGGGMAGASATDCTFIQNLADQTGGGIRDATATRCAFVANRAISASGGGMQGGTAKSCYFTANRAKTTGGGTCYTTLNNCTLTGNRAEGDGGGAYAGYANNSICWNNISEAEGNDLRSAHPWHTCSPDAPHGTDGCITNDPQLVSASHIAAGSPCIGAGDPARTPATDIDGEAWNNPPSMGCDEIGAALSGPVEMAFYGPSPIRSLTEGDYVALFDGPVSKTIVDFGHGAPLTNTTGLIRHLWPGPGAQNYEVVLTAFNDDYPQGTSITQTVEVVDDAFDQHVWSSGDDLNDGLSWETAKKTIQAAIDAQNVANGKVIVDGNTYFIPSPLSIDKPVHLVGYNADGTDGLVPVVDAGGSNRCVDITALECEIENFVFQNGATPLQSYSDNAGGGIRCRTTDPRIYNCTVRKCTAYYGGAVQKGSLVHCTLRDNVATQGGAAYQSVLDDCTITSNSATYGGGVHSCPALSGCTLSNNYASSYGGAAYSCTLLTNCTLVANQADSQGGGAYGCTLDFCTITSNAAPTAGGLYNSTADRCEFTTNNATLDYGGAMYGGTARSCVFHLNRAEKKGGATYNTILRNCTVVGNGALDTGGSYGGYIYNSILWDNFAWSNAVNVSGVTPMSSCYPEADPADAYHGNITNNPQFVSHEPGLFFRGGDYYLGPYSPCLNAGDNSQVQTGRDYNGWDRILYGTVDMGANEAYFFDDDTDGDGMPDGWELEEFGGTTNAVADGDEDGDAFDNRSEYIAGTDPHDPSAYLHITRSEVVVGDDGTASVTLHWAPSVEGRIYGVSWSTNLMDGFQDRGLSLPYPADQIGFDNDLPESFYEINVRLDN